MSKNQPNRSYRSPVIKETVKGQNPERGNRERQRDRSNLGGALAPPTPWEPRTRGETLLPSREKVKEEEEEGGLSPPCFRWRRSTAGGHHHHRDLHQHLHHLHQHLHHLPPLSTAVHSPATRCTLYLNMVLYASYYYPMMCCHPMMSE